MDGFNTLVVTKIVCYGVTSVDSEELALYIWFKVIDLVNALNIWPLRLEAGGGDTPFVEALDYDIKARSSRLSWDKFCQRCNYQIRL